MMLYPLPQEQRPYKNVLVISVHKSQTHRDIRHLSNQFFFTQSIGLRFRRTSSHYKYLCQSRQSESDCVVRTENAEDVLAFSDLLDGFIIS